jgi:chaperonin cofactor prefoldin
MDVRFGKLRPNNAFLNSSLNHTDGNFFVENSNPEVTEQREQTVGLRINDYDSSILENNAYQLLSDDMFKTEHKIGILENTLTRINSEITALQSLGAAIQISELIERKEKIERELAELNKIYSELGISTMISGQIASAVSFTAKKRRTFLSKARTFISRKILAKISPRICLNQSMRDALENLCNINLGVNELIKMQIPYGETSKRYEKLTAYLNKANTIHSQIARNMDAIAKKK